MFSKLFICDSLAKKCKRFGFLFGVEISVWTRFLLARGSASFVIEFCFLLK